MVARGRRRDHPADRKEQGEAGGDRAALRRAARASRPHAAPGDDRSHQQPPSPDGLGSSFNKAKINAGMADRDLHFHDLRGTAATRFYVAGLSERVIAEIMGWEETKVARIIRRYVGRAAATQAIIRQLDRAKGRT